MRKKRKVIVAPPAELPVEKRINGGNDAVPEDFWDIDEPAVLGLFVGHYYEISIDTFFNASHSVVIKGRRGPVHTHSYRLGVRCRSRSISGKEQVIADYTSLRDRINQVAKAYNHQHLNDLPPFRQLKSTTENLTAVLFQQLTKALKGLPIELVSITLWESPSVAVTLTKDELVG
ncbi:MAG: 6-carboxytetrahydropterin synthase [Anaerolineales bacterium]